MLFSTLSLKLADGSIGLGSKNAIYGEVESCFDEISLELANPIAVHRWSNKLEVALLIAALSAIGCFMYRSAGILPASECNKNLVYPTSTRGWIHWIQ
jgi:hypothetical protein